MTGSPRDLLGDAPDNFADGAAKAVVFIEKYTADWHPDWWLNLCAIWPDADGRPLEGRSWRVAEIRAKRAEIRAWVEARNRVGMGVYLTPNPTLRPVHGKPSDKDIAAVVVLAIDVDPDCAQHGGYDAARTALWQELDAARADGRLASTWTVNSGNGAGLFCRLAMPADPDMGRAASTALQARARGYLAGATVDHTPAPSHLMRLPYLRNLPKRSKLEKGYPAGGAWGGLRACAPDARLSPECVAELAAEAPQGARTDPASIPQEQHRAPSAERLIALVRDMPNPATIVWNPAVKIIRSIRAAATGVLEDDGREEAREWVMRHEGAPATEEYFDDRWRSVAGPSLVGWSFLVETAVALGSEVGKAEAEALPFESAKRDFAGLDALELAASPGAGHNGGPPMDATPVGFTEDSLAATFTRRHGEDWRYVAAWGAWHRWDGCRWRRDDTCELIDLVRTTCRDIARRADKESLQHRLSRAATVAAVERLARADRQHARNTDGWDASSWLLNTPDGVVDLRTGAMGDHDRDLLMTKVAAVGPAPRTVCPTWLRFLDDATGGDAEAIEFLRRWCGYCLTGDTREHALLFVFGPGGNGKSVFLNTLVGIMGDYAMTAGMETFAASKGERHPTELARLRGARLVTASETEEGRAWAEARIKALTGGDPITAHFMRQDDFTFVPQFKLVIAGNHKPRLRTPDDAARRRFNLMPFLHKPERPDRDLERKLRAERSGILRWMIDGCLAWQRDGMPRPGIVSAATAEYFEAEDPVARWIEDCCERNAAARSKTADLYNSFAGWVRGNREPERSKRWLSEALAARGFQQWRDAGGRGFSGLRLLQAAPAFP